MNGESDNSRASNLVDWTCTALTVAAFLAYILVIAFRPELFRQPIAEGTLISVGIAWGVVLSVFVVALAGLYSWLRNRSDRE